MLVRVAVLADYASLSEMVKLNVMGIFSMIIASRVPCVHPQMQLVCQIEFDTDEAGKKDLRISMIDADGHELFGIDGEMLVPRDSEGEPTTVSQILCLNNVRFENYGAYEFRVSIDGGSVATIPVRVVRPRSRPPVLPVSSN